MTIPTMPQGRWVRAVSDQLLKSGDGVVLAVLLNAGTSGAQFELNDSTAGSGADFLEFLGIVNTPYFFDFSPLGGVPFQTGCWIDWTAGSVWICLDD